MDTVDADRYIYFPDNGCIIVARNHTGREMGGGEASVIRTRRSPSAGERWSCHVEAVDHVYVQILKPDGWSDCHIHMVTTAAPMRRSIIPYARQHLQLG